MSGISCCALLRPNSPFFVKSEILRFLSGRTGSVTQSGTGSVTYFVIPCRIAYEQLLEMITEPTGGHVQQDRHHSEIH